MIKTVDLKKTFVGRGQTVHAVDGVTAHIKPGEVVVIIGPSGSGKSTYLRCLNGLETLTSGHIHVDGIDLADRKPTSTRYAAKSVWYFSNSTFSHIKQFWKIWCWLKWLCVNATVLKQKKKGRELLAKVGIAEKEKSIRSACPAASNSGLPSPGR